MIEYKNGVFRIGSPKIAYLFRVTQHGLLEHLHFGAAVPIEDARTRGKSRHRLGHGRDLR